MALKTINVLLSSFPGLGLPTTLSLPTPASTPLASFYKQLAERLPSISTRLILTTTSNKSISPSSSSPISSLLSANHGSLLPLRLTVPLCGGKGGFGSQLRAAGGRMSSKHKKNTGENNSSNRNLDGRRLRTVNEAKALAEYLALKPEMEKKEKEARRKRWEQVLELAEKREEEIRSGNKGKVDGKWMEDKEEAGERARGAVEAAMKSGIYRDNLGAGPSDGNKDDQVEESSDEEADEETEALESSISGHTSTVDTQAQSSRMLFGFDEDDEFMSDSSGNAEDDDASSRSRPEETDSTAITSLASKGKARL